MKGKITISTAMILAATSAFSGTEKNIELDDSFEVSQEIQDELDQLFQSKAVHDKLSEDFSGLIRSLKNEDVVLFKKYFSDYTDKEGTEVANADSTYRSSATNTRSCYSNCYSNCHSACHGSRSWR